jgi:hypothetical protein
MAVVAAVLRAANSSSEPRRALDWVVPAVVAQAVQGRPVLQQAQTD